MKLLCKSQRFFLRLSSTPLEPTQALIGPWTRQGDLWNKSEYDNVIVKCSRRCHMFIDAVSDSFFVLVIILIVFIFVRSRLFCDYCSSQFRVFTHLSSPKERSGVLGFLSILSQRILLP